MLIMRRILIRTILYSIALFLISCEYQLHEEFVHDIPGPDPSGIRLRLNPEQESYTVYGTTVFTCEALTEGLKIYKVKAYVDGKEVNMDPDEIAGFTIHNQNYSEGLHTLTVEVTTSSATGSLADLLGVEGYIFTNNWKLIIDKSPPEKVNITKIFNDNGILRIEWEKYPGENFAHYYLFKREFYDAWGGERQALVGRVSDINQTFCYDSTYVGGEARYFLQAVSPIYLTTNSDTVTFADQGTGFSLEWEGEDLVTLQWNKCKYDKAFTSYTIAIDYDTAITIRDIVTTSVTGHFALLAGTRTYTFEIVPQQTGIMAGGLSSVLKHSPGLPFYKFDDLLKNSVNDRLLIVNGQKVLKYDQSSDALLDSFPHRAMYPDYLLSPSNEVLISSGVPDSRIDPETFEIIDMPGIDPVSSNLSQTSWGLAFANNQSVLYDFRNMSPVTGLAWANNPERYLSLDNRFVFELRSGLQCRKIENGQLNLQWTHTSEEFMLVPDDPGKIIIAADGRIEVRDIESNTLLKSIPCQGWFVLFTDIDPASGTVLAMLYAAKGKAGNDRLLLIDYNQGRIIKSLPAVQAGYHLCNNMLYYSGYKMPLNLN